MSSIPLMVQPPQPVQGPIQQAQQGASLAGLLQQQRIQQQMAPGQMQLQQQAIQTGQQEQQLRQIQIQDAQAGQKALQDWDGSDPDALPDLIRKNGGSFNAVMSARQGILGMKTAAQKLQTDQLDNLGKTNDIIAGHLESVKGATDKQSAFDGAISDLEQRGLIKPGQISHQYPGDDQLNLLEKQFMTQKTITDQELAQRKQATEEQSKQLEAAKFGAELPGGVLEDPTKKYLRLSAAEDAGQKLAAPDAAFVKAFGQKMDRETTLRYLNQNRPFDIFGGGGGGGAPAIPGQPASPTAPIAPGQPQAGVAPAPAAVAGGGAPSTAAQSAPQVVQPGTAAKPASTTETAATNPKVIQGASPVDPGAWASNPRVQAINPNYRGTLLSVLNYLTPDLSVTRPNTPNSAIMNEVRTLDPSHDATAFPARNQIQKEYTKSATDGQIGAINTALGHLGELYEAAKLIGGSDLPALHALQNKWHMAIGDDANATYNYIANKVGDETTSAYIKGGGGEKDREADQKSFSLANGQKAIIGTIGSAASLLNSKIASQRNNWQQTFKPSTTQEQFDNRWLTPEARQTLATLSQLAPTNKTQQQKTAGNFNFDAFPKVQ